MNDISAFVLMNTKTGQIDNVIEKLEELIGGYPGLEVIYADSTTGKFDIITLIKGEDMRSLYNFIVGILRAIPGITSTITEVVAYDVKLEKEETEITDGLKCYVLMKVDVGSVDNVLNILANMDGKNSSILKVSCTTGEYDIIARVQSMDIPSLHNFISKKVHAIDGITDTMTHIVAKEIT